MSRTCERKLVPCIGVDDRHTSAVHRTVCTMDKLYTLKDLPTTPLGTFIENRVNSFLETKNAGAGPVSVKVLVNDTQVVKVLPEMTSIFVENYAMAGSFPYRPKTIFAFQEEDEKDMCVCCMYVQEYGSDCAKPNTGRVYISYQDTEHFFKPRQLTAEVDHEILIGYLEYTKQQGYVWAHIWTCPPNEGDDYIFHCHHPGQKIPKPKRSHDWYKDMLDKAVLQRVVIDYKDILKDAVENNIMSATELPYFEGDFWPIVLEESIKKLHKNGMKKRKREEASATASEQESGEIECDIDNNPKRAIKKKDLTQMLYTAMEKHKEVFFVIRLHTQQIASSLPPIQDPDPFISCDLMDARDAFLTMARDKHQEFTSLQKAKLSTMALSFGHYQGGNNCVYTCNNCNDHIETRWHCVVCEEYYMCSTCYESGGHTHKMEKLGLDIDNDCTPSEKRDNLPKFHCHSNQHFIQPLGHASQCRDPQFSTAAATVQPTLEDNPPPTQNVQMQTWPPLQQHNAATGDRTGMGQLPPPMYVPRPTLQQPQPSQPSVNPNAPRPTTPLQQQQVLHILKSNPQLMAAFLKQRTQSQHNQQQAGNQQPHPTQPNHPGHRFSYNNNRKDSK